MSTLKTEAEHAEMVARFADEARSIDDASDYVSHAWSAWMLERGEAGSEVFQFILAHLREAKLVPRSGGLSFQQAQDLLREVPQ